MCRGPAAPSWRWRSAAGRTHFTPGWNRGWKPWRAWTDVKHSHCCAWMQTTPAQRSNDRGTEKFCTFGLWIEDGMPLETPRRPQRAGRACPGRRSGRHAEAKKGPGFPAGFRCTLEKEESDKYGVDRTKVRRLIGP